MTEVISTADGGAGDGGVGPDPTGFDALPSYEADDSWQGAALTFISPLNFKPLFKYTRPLEVFIPRVC